MSDMIQLNTELLLEQSGQMMQLKAAYESLFDNIASDLKGINSCWSDLLSNNFSGKIISAQRTFTGTLGMLQNSASKASMVANAIAEFDSWQAGKIGGGAGKGSGGGHAFGGGTGGIGNMLLNLFNNKTPDEMRKVLNGMLMNGGAVNGEFPLHSSVEAWKEKIIEDLIEEQFGKKGLNIFKVAKDAFEGDYGDAFQKIGGVGMTEVIRAVAEAQGITLEGSDLGQYTKYTINLIDSVASAATECLMGEPTVGEALNFAWACTGEPILDTAGKKIYDTINLIPGVSEYWAERGVTGASDMGPAALKEFYRLATGSDEAAEYVGKFYDGDKGFGEAISGLGSEVVSFVKDSGGLGKAIESFGKTAIKDFQDVLAYQGEVAKMCWNSILGK